MRCPGPTCPAGRRAVRRALVVLAALALVVGGAAAPATAGSGVALSRDGVSYSATIPDGLFGPVTIAVPGDSQTTEFWVRNAGPVPAYLRVAIANVTVSDPVLAGALSVTASTSAHPGAVATLASANPCWVLTEGDLLSPGDTVHVTAGLALGDLQGIAGQGGTAAFDMRIGLSDSVIPLPPTSCGSTGTDARVAGGSGAIPLASTGAEAPLPVIMVAASVLGAGLFLLVAARRRREAQG